MTTNSGGWDAVCAINAANLNQLFLHWYLANHPTTARMRIQAWQPVNDPNALILDAELSPPEITFLVDGPAQQAQISMIVTGGTLVFFDMYSGGVSSMQQLQPDTARVTGTVDLAKVEGSLALGEVQLQLGSGTYQPAVSGLDPNSDAASGLGSAIDDYFCHNNVVLPLGGVVAANVPDCLQPSFFQFWMQPNPEVPGDGCVLLLIQTNGSLGSFGCLPTYPIPDGSTAALIVSNQVLFNQVFPAQLTASMASVGLTFSGSKQADGTYQACISDSNLDLGVLTYSSIMFQPSSSNGDRDGWGTYQPSDVTLPLDGLTLAPSGGQLSLAYDYQWTQGWCWQETLHDRNTSLYDTAPTHLWYSAAASPTVADPSLCVVTFALSSTPQCQSSMDTQLSDVFGNTDPGSQVQDEIAREVAPVFQSLKVGDVDTFALQNILFYNHSLNLPNGSIPDDLVLTGSVVPQLMLTPTSVAVEPGSAPVQFTASLNGQTPTSLLWSVTPSVGSGTIDANGCYTPPTSIDRPKVALVVASDGNDAGRAMVLLYHAQPGQRPLGCPTGGDRDRGSDVRLRGHRRPGRAGGRCVDTRSVQSRWRQHEPGQRHVDVYGAGERRECQYGHVDRVEHVQPGRSRQRVSHLDPAGHADDLARHADHLG